MTPFLSLSVALGLLTLAWLTHPLWLRRAAPTRFDATVPVASPGRTPATIAALAALVLAVVGIGYAWVGAPQHLAVAPTPSAAPRPDAHRTASPSAPADAAMAQAQSRVAAMIASLADRLAAHPDDADGWRTLARSYAAIGRHAAAVDAFKTAARLRPDDPGLLADYAVSAAMLDAHPAGGEAAQLVARALQLDPANPKALALAGTLALQRKDYAAAIDHWERLARIEAPGSPIAKQLDVSLLQARRLAGIQGTSPPSAAALLPAADAHIGGTVTLAPALLARAAPDDTVYVSARAAAGPRMPLAVLRKQVRDLPLHFVLDDSMAMAPSATLSAAGRVVVGARIARSGSALPRDGDLQGELPATALGRDDLRLEINEVVKRR